MGRASRRRAQLRTTMHTRARNATTTRPAVQRPGELDVWGAGQLDVLSVGRGHLRLTVDEGDAMSMEKARRVITDMLARGFAIFVEDEHGHNHRVTGFDPDHMSYLIDDTMATIPAAHAPAYTEQHTTAPVDEPAPTPKRRGRPPKVKVPVASAKATAVGRTAGG